MASAAPGAVDLKGAYHSALEKSESVQIERAKVSQAEERKSQAQGAVYPQLSLNGRYTRQDTGPTPVGGTAAFTNPDQYSASLGATQALFHGLSDFAELRRRDVLIRAQQAEELRQRQGLYLLVAQRFYAVLAAERDLANLRTLSDLTAKRVNEIRQRVRIGRSRQGELLSSESQTATLEAQLAGAQTEVTRARESLRVTTLLPLDAMLADPGDKLPGTPAALDTWLAGARARPDLQALDLQREAADELVGVAKGGHLPSLDAGANYYLTRTGVLANSKWDVTLNLTVPLFRGGTTAATVGEAVEVRKQAELGLALARREAEAEVRNGHARLVSLTGQVQTLKRASELAEKNYRTQNSDYRLGLVTNLEVISALNTFQETKRVFDKTYFETWSSLAALEAAAGKAP